MDLGFALNASHLVAFSANRKDVYVCRSLTESVSIFNVVICAWCTIYFLFASATDKLINTKILCLQISVFQIIPVNYCTNSNAYHFTICMVAIWWILTI